MFARLPPYLSVPLFYTVVTTGALYKFFFGNIFGILLATIALYYFSEPLFGITPLGFHGLMDWIVDQSESTKTALLSSIVTIIGFLIAYATATANWKSELLANLKLQMAGELEAFFAECSKFATDCGIYVESLLEAVDRIQNGCTDNEAIFLARYNRDQGQTFLQKRQQLVSLGIEVHRFQGKYSTLLISAPWLKSNLDSATKALQRVTEKIWIHVPYHIQQDRDPVRTFVSQVNVIECNALKEAIIDNSAELNFSSGAVRGILMSPVVGFNMWALFYLFKERKAFSQAIAERYKILRKSNKPE